MAYVRQLPSGKWAATVRLPGGERVTESFRLKGHADDWAADLESDIRRQDWVDPRGGQTTVAEVWDRWGAGRRLERASKERDASHYRTYVLPRWGRTPVGAILKPDIDAWITQMEERKPTPVKATSIQPAIGVLRAILQMAVDARLIKFNVATMVKAPARAAHLDRVLDDDEADILLTNAEARFPGKPYAALFLEVLLYAGLRYGEAAALNRDWVETRRRLLHVGPTLLKDGTIKDKPKSRAGIRPVPVDDVLWPKLREHVLTIPPGGLLFTAERGGELLYDHWRDRVWSRCLTTEREMTAAEVEAWKVEQVKAGKKRAWRPRWVVEVPVLDSPLPTPHDLRHTYGTRLGEAGVPQHEIMALMGHEDPESVQRYLHAREGRFDKARAAMVAARLAGQR